MGSNDIIGPHCCCKCVQSTLFCRDFFNLSLCASLGCFRRLTSAPLSALQFPHVAARAHLMLPYKCPHITAECVNHTVTSQERLASTSPAAQSGPKATGYIPGNISLHAPWETKVGFFQRCLNAL